MSDNEKVGFFSGLPNREKSRITLPSGRKITVLETTGREEKILSRMRDRSKVAETILEYLVSVTEDLDDQKGKISPVQFEEMLVGDRIFILLHARVLTHGSMVRHKHPCPECGSQSEHEIDTQPVIDAMKPYPGGDQREFSLDLGGGVLHYELPNGRHEAKIAKQKDLDINSKLRFLRMWEVTSQGNFPVSLDSLKSKQIAALRQDLRSHECLIDTLVELTCPQCDRVSTVDIVGMSDFLFPSLV